MIARTLRWRASMMISIAARSGIRMKHPPVCLQRCKRFFSSKLVLIVCIWRRGCLQPGSMLGIARR